MKTYQVFAIAFLFLFFNVSGKVSAGRNVQYPPLKSWVGNRAESLTNEQIAIRKAIADILSHNVTVKNNKLNLNLSKSNFSTTGLPKAYYRQIKQALRQTNKAIKKQKIGNVKEIYKDSMRDYINNKDEWFQ